MADTLPTFSKAIDDAFTETWYEIKPQAVDNILDATVVTAALKMDGTFTPQVGSDEITETVRYGEETASPVAKGDVLPSGEPKLETVARWEWRYTASHVQRSIVDDQQNNGKFKIKDYVAKRLGAARDALEQQIESDLFRAFTSGEGGKSPASLVDIVPLEADRSTSTYGKINRASTYSSSADGTVATGTGDNPWWGAKYLSGTSPKEINLLSEMAKLYNSCHNNQSAPNLIICDQDTYEVYGEFALDKTQIIKDATTQLADLGFEVLRYRGKRLVWTPNITAGHMIFLNTQFIKWYYDPQLWFDMTEFKPIPLQLERIAHILIAWNLVSNQLRRHGRLYY